MNYHSLAKEYYSNRDEFESIYRERFEHGIKLNIDINGYQAFFSDEKEIYKGLLNIERIDKDICELAGKLPKAALIQYEKRCLIDEIILTNDIEGVYSTRKEIGALLNELEKKSRNYRFFGLVNKYLMLSKGDKIDLNVSEDVRELYDELFLDEVRAEDPKDVPDGLIFRNGPVTIIDSRQRAVHEGLLPESLIIDTMDKSLDILGNEQLEIIVRTALFHYLFGYIHPFYEGNGRMSRFISSYMLGKAIHPLASYRLSYVIKDNINRYYKAFKECNDIHNRGDLTPFILFFIDIITKVCEQLREDLRERSDRLTDLSQIVLSYSDDEKMQELYHYLLQAALFADEGISATELEELLNVSRPTLNRRLDRVRNKGHLNTITNGKIKYYRLDVEQFL